jgi:dynein heavy chain, axonemal
MQREVKSMAVARTLENKMKAFKDALPLMADLKHEALRERFIEYLNFNFFFKVYKKILLPKRHWKQLMKETGIEFDMNPETFTLANLFAMELHRFNEVIQGIVTSASKELQIEKVK